MIKLVIEGLGIIDGDQKRVLECYFDSRFFRQRKSYDEYYIDSNEVDADISLNDLRIISENFKVEVHPDSICIGNKQ